MRETKTARTLGLKDAGWGASAYPRERPIHVTFGPAGEVSDEHAEVDAAAEWLNHVKAGRIGGA